MADNILIDRADAVGIFQSLLESKESIRVLRIVGEAKMGKSRLLREYKRIAAEKFSSKHVLVDLRSRLQSFDDILYQIAQRVGFDFFLNCRKVFEEFSSQPRIEVSRVSQLFSTISIKNDLDREKYRIKRLLIAFLSDLRGIVSEGAIVVLMFDAFEEADEEVQRWINDTLVTELCYMPNLYVVLAGQRLPEPLTSWQDMSTSYKLQPVDIEDHRNYCTRIGITIEENLLIAFHRVFEGRPGLFVEFVSKL